MSFDGREATFDPSSPGSPAPQTISGSSFGAVSCPTATQCTAVGVGPTASNGEPQGYESTFNPQTPSAGSGAVVDTGTAILNGQFCFTGLCPDNALLTQVSCPAADECIASDVLARLLTFDPQSPGTPSLRNNAGGTLDCPSADACLLATGGSPNEFDPLSWTPQASTSLRPAGHSDLVSCPTADECVLSDNAGDVIVGTGLAGPSPPPPPAATATSTTATKSADTVDVECYAAPTTSCAVTVTLLVHETLLGGRVRAVTARRRRETRRVLLLARANTIIAGGGQSTLTLRLNAAGRRLLKQRHAFTASLTASVSGVTRSNTVRLVE